MNIPPTPPTPDNEEASGGGSDDDNSASAEEDSEEEFQEEIQDNKVFEEEEDDETPPPDLEAAYAYALKFADDNDISVPAAIRNFLRTYKQGGDYSSTSSRKRGEISGDFTADTDIIIDLTLSAEEPPTVT